MLGSLNLTILVQEATSSLHAVENKQQGVVQSVSHVNLRVYFVKKEDNESGI